MINESLLRQFEISLTKSYRVNWHTILDNPVNLFNFNFFQNNVTFT